MTTARSVDQVDLDAFDLSDPEFWLAPRDYREGAFKTLRDTPGLVNFEEWEFLDSPFPAGARLLGAHPPRRHLAREPQPAAVLPRQGHATSATCPRR